MLGKRGPIIAIVLVVIALVAIRPWRLRWTVDREMPSPIVVETDATLAPHVSELSRKIKSISVEAPSEDGSHEDGARLAPKNNALAGLDPALYRTSYTDSVNFLVGYKDGHGQITIPARFDWGGPFENGRAKVEIEGKFGMIDLNGQLVVPAEFDSIFDYVDGVAVAQKDGWFFFVDSTGRPVSDERFDYAWPHKDGMALVKKDGFFGYADLQGHLAIPLNLEETFGFNEGLAVAKISGVFGVLDKGGRFVVTPQYDYAWPVEKGSVLVRKNGETFSVDVSSFTEPPTTK